MIILRKERKMVKTHMIQNRNKFKWSANQSDDENNQVIHEQEQEDGDRKEFFYKYLILEYGIIKK
jgi:hypothetical protein